MRLQSIKVWSPCMMTALYCIVTRWFKEFTRGHQSLEDDFWSGRPSNAVNLISIATAEKQIMTNQKVKLSEIAKSYKF